MGGVQLEAERRAKDVVAEVARGARLVQGLLEALVVRPDLAVNVVVADRYAHRIGGDRHALDHDVRVVAQDVAVLERSGFAFVGVADHVLLAGKLPRHEAPFEPGRKACAAAASERGLLHVRNYRLGRDVFREDPAQRLVAVACLVVLQAPVRAVETREDHRLDMTAVEAALQRHVT